MFDRCPSCPFDAGDCYPRRRGMPGLCQLLGPSRIADLGTEGGPFNIYGGGVSHGDGKAGGSPAMIAVADLAPCRHRGVRGHCGERSFICALGKGQSGIIEPESDCPGCPEAQA